MRLLIVEDTPELSDALRDHFANEGHTCDCAESVAAARAMLDTPHVDYDLAILDISLPDGMGTELIPYINDLPMAMGIVVLTAKSELTDKVHVLDVGADDYLTKPFAIDELDARVRAVYRRHQKKPVATRSFFMFEYDPRQRIFWAQGQQVDLRSQELKLLEAFLETPGHQCTKPFLMDRLYGLSQAPTENAVEVHVSRLRAKLKPFGATVSTIRGVGYRFEAQM